MSGSTIQFVTPSEQLPHCNSADLRKFIELVLQLDVAGNGVNANAGSDSLEAHIAKMSIANSSGTLKRQFRNIVTEK
jgi:hypothetical protein